MRLWFKYMEKGEKTLLPSSHSISLGGLSAPSHIFHPHGTVYFYLFRKISVKSYKMDHPPAGLRGLEGKSCGEYCDREEAAKE